MTDPQTPAETSVENVEATSTRLREVDVGQGLVSVMYRWGAEQRSITFDSNDPDFADLPYVVPRIFKDGHVTLENPQGAVLKTYLFEETRNG